MSTSPYMINHNIPLVSVLIPVYNRESFVADCVRSAQIQTVNNIEIIVVDNASDDGSYEICKELAENDGRIKVFRNNKNIGPVKNWFECIGHARGRFAKFLFSDDMLFPDYLEKTIPFLDDDSVGFVFTAADIGPNIDKVSWTGYKWKGRSSVVDSSEFISSVFSRGDVPPSPGCALFRLSDIKKNLITKGFTSNEDEVLRYGAGTDLLFYLLTASQYPRVGHVPTPHVFFRHHSGSITVDKREVVKKLYWQAKVWFLENHLNEGVIKGNVLARAWAEMSLVSGRYIDKNEMKYVFPRSEIGLPIKDSFYEMIQYINYLVCHRVHVFTRKVLSGELVHQIKKGTN